MGVGWGGARSHLRRRSRPSWWSGRGCPGIAARRSRGAACRPAPARAPESTGGEGHVVRRPRAFASTGGGGGVQAVWWGDGAAQAVHNRARTSGAGGRPSDVCRAAPGRLHGRNIHGEPARGARAAPVCSQRPEPFTTADGQPAACGVQATGRPLLFTAPYTFTVPPCIHSGGWRV